MRASTATTTATTRSRLLAWLLALPPLAYLCWMVASQTVDVPFADQWALVPLLDKSYGGTLTLGDLWAQHNEHRLFAPRIVMIWLARATGWSTRAEMAINIVLACATLLTVAWLLRRTAHHTGRSLALLIPGSAVCLFSLNQAENWWAGWNIQIFLSAWAVALAVALLTAERRPVWAALGAAALGALASASYSHGLLIWPIGVVLIVLLPSPGATRHPLPVLQGEGLASTTKKPLALQNRERGWGEGSRERGWGEGAAARLAIWLGAAGALLWLFFRGYAPTQQMPQLSAVLDQLGLYVRYTLAAIGAPLGRGASEWLFGALTGDTGAICNLGDSGLCDTAELASILAGGAGVLLLGIAGALVWRRYGRAAALPWLALGTYVLTSAALTSLGRASFGVRQALAQRYATTTTLFWIALLVLAAVLLLDRRLAGWARGAAGLAGGLIVAAALLGTLQGRDHFRIQREFLEPGRAALLTLEDDALLARIYPDPAVVRQLAPVLQKHNLSVYRD